MKIVIMDGHALNPGDLSFEPLAQFGDLTVYDHTPDELIVPRIGDAEIIFINKISLTRETLLACPSIRFIGVLATGYNIVDTAAAKELGILVTNIPSYGTQAVGQFAIAMLLEICHRIGHHSAAVYAGRWEKNEDFCFWDYPLIELWGKTMGIIGFGRIGQCTGRIAQALGMNVLAVDNQQFPELVSPTCRYVDLDTLFKESDVISLHCPLFPETQGIINRSNIARMKDGVILLNNSRGPLVVETDLADALNSGKVYAAGVDVVSVEPIQSDNPLLKAKNCFITPHISWGPKESRQRLLNIAIDNLHKFLAGDAQNVVNP